MHRKTVLMLVILPVHIVRALAQNELAIRHEFMNFALSADNSHVHLQYAMEKTRTRFAESQRFLH